MAVATNENQTSSSGVPPQVLACEDAVAPIRLPETVCAQLVSGFTGTTIAFIHSSFGISVQKLFGPAHKLESVAEQTALT